MAGRRLRRGGFAFLGKTNMPEFSSDMTVSKLNGVTHNPWDLSRTPGGSSGGAAAAVAAGLCAVAHGTDGAGSTRVPAAWCGLVGFKPSRGMVAYGPYEGPVYFGTSEPGVVSRSVRDAAAVLDLLAPPGPWTPGRDGSFLDAVSAQDGARLRIGICTTPPMGTVEPDCAAAADSVAMLLSDLGHHVEAVMPAWDVILAAFGPMSVPGPAAHVTEADLDHVEPRNRPTITRLSTLTILEHYRWVEAVRTAQQRFCELWSSIDILVTPDRRDAPATSSLGLSGMTTRWRTELGLPRSRILRSRSTSRVSLAISLPLGWSAEGLPIGVQLVGRSLDEPTLLQLAAELETARPWRDQIRSAAHKLDTL